MVGSVVVVGITGAKKTNPSVSAATTMAPAALAADLFAGRYYPFGITTAIAVEPVAFDRIGVVMSVEITIVGASSLGYSAPSADSSSSSSAFVAACPSWN